MDGVDIICAIAILVVIVLPVVILFLNQILITPYAAENANQQCIARGFDYAEKFENAWFNAQAFGVKCAIVSVDKRTIDVNGSAVVVAN